MEYYFNKVDMNIRNNASPEVKKDKVHMKGKLGVGNNLIKSKEKEQGDRPKKRKLPLKKCEVKVNAERYKELDDEIYKGIYLDQKK